MREPEVLIWEALNGRFRARNGGIDDIITNSNWDTACFVANILRGAGYDMTGDYAKPFTDLRAWHESRIDKHECLGARENLACCVDDLLDAQPNAEPSAQAKPADSPQGDGSVA